MPKRALFFREIKDETTATRNILLCVRRTTLARPRGFDFFRTRKSPLRRPTFAFRAHSERRQLDMTTTSAVLSAYPLWSRLSTTVLSASPHFGRGQVRGAPCTESISTLVAAESTRSTGWAALARSMARSSMAKIEHGAEHTPQVHRRIRSHHRQRRSATPAQDSMRMAPTHCGEDSTPRFTPSFAQGWACTGPGRWEGRHILRDFDREMYFAAKLADWSFFPCFTDDARWYSRVSAEWSDARISSVWPPYSHADIPFKFPRRNSGGPANV